MTNLILTLDYEVFGDGTGDVFKHVIEPTKRMLQICDKYGIKVTIFVEAIEYIKIKEEWNKGNKMGYVISPVEAIDNQIRNAALDGHDIQLHLHPQWANAKYANDKWELDFSNWRLGDFHSSDEHPIKDLLRRGITDLENIIKPVLPTYKCIALRAGGYNVMPSSEVYTAMKELGLKIDSSIYPGGYENGTLSKYDYRMVPRELDFWWADKTDMRKKAHTNKEILEFPIFALPVPRWKKVMTLSRLKSLLNKKNGKISSVTKEKIVSKTYYEKIKFILQKEVYTWDACMFSKALHDKFFTHIEKYFFVGYRNNFVLIGHPKSLEDENLFTSFIQMAIDRKKEYKFITLHQAYANIS